MAAVLEGEGKLKNALRHYLEVCYLDLNGPQNRGETWTDGKVKLIAGQNFIPEDAIFAPAVTAKVIEIILALKMNKHQVRHEFVDVAQRDSQNLRLPVPPTKAWDELSSELYV